jgi:hypothetical protein
MYDWRMAGEDMLAKVPGADANEVGDWVTSAYQAAVKELING